MMTFCFQVSAYLHILNEPAGWKVEGPVNGFKTGFIEAKNGLGENVTRAFLHLSHIFNIHNLMKRRVK
jgi:hypothetical protein